MHTHLLVATDEGRLSQPRRRALLRLLGELVVVGVLPGPTPLQRLLTDLAAALPWDSDREAAANNLALLAHFVKVRTDYHFSSR